MPEESTEHLSLRQEEIFALSSIYNELHLNNNNLSGSLSIPVQLDHPILLLAIERETQLRFLPPLKFTFATSPSYPESAPPTITLECSWITENVLRRVEEDVGSLWGNDICLFTMIDELFERTKSVFGMDVVNVEVGVYDEVIAFAEGEEMKMFLEGTYFCEICLEKKKGGECVKLPRCGHVSCRVRPPSQLPLLSLGFLLWSGD
jgi:E3 ubiquitin-protein ligase RNF14